MHAKPILGRDLHELDGDFLLDPDDLPGGGGSEPGGGGGGGDLGGERGFYGDPESGASEVCRAGMTAAKHDNGELRFVNSVANSPRVD